MLEVNVDASQYIRPGVHHIPLTGLYGYVPFIAEKLGEDTTLVLVGHKGLNKAAMRQGPCLGDILTIHWEQISASGQDKNFAKLLSIYVSTQISLCNPPRQLHAPGQVLDHKVNGFDCRTCAAGMLQALGSSGCCNHPNT